MGAGVFHIIFESSPEAIALTRVRDGAIVQVNREWESMTGYRREEVVGRTALALGHWLHPEQRTSIFGDLKPGGRVMDVDVSLVMKDGSPRVVRLNATMLMEAGEAYILIYLRDVTADLLAREALRSGELALAHANTAMNRQVKLHELTESVAQVGHWVNYPGDKTVYLSPGLAQIAGLEQEAVVTMDMLWGRVFPEDLPALHQARHRMDGEVVEFRSSGPGGRTLWARSPPVIAPPGVRSATTKRRFPSSASAATSWSAIPTAKRRVRPSAPTRSGTTRSSICGGPMVSACRGR